jgi:hypothetical protein
VKREWHPPSTTKKTPSRQLELALQAIAHIEGARLINEIQTLVSEAISRDGIDTVRRKLERLR